MYRFKVKVTSKGQMTLPAAFRRLAAVREGDTLDLIVDDEGHATLKKRSSIDDLVGSLRHLSGRLGRPLDKADIKGSVDEAMAEQEERSRAKRR